jgi:hypothetical protein
MPSVSYSAADTTIPIRKELAMKAIRIHEPTGISGFVYEEAPDATPMIGDVLVKVAACGITHRTALSWPTSRAWSMRDTYARRSAPYPPRRGRPGVPRQSRRRHPRPGRPPALTRCERQPVSAMTGPARYEIRVERIGDLGLVLILVRRLDHGQAGDHASRDAAPAG